MAGSNSLPWVNAPVNQTPTQLAGIGEIFINARKRKQEQDQKAAEMLLQKQRLEADKLRMQAEEHRAAAEERRAAAQEQRARDTDERAKRIEAAQLIGQAPQMLDNPAQWQSLAQAHGLQPEMQTPNLPAMPPQPGQAPQEPAMPMAGPLETPEGASNRAISENIANVGQGQPMQQPDAAAQEVLKQQQERDQYQQALAAHPDLVKQHAAQVDQFKQYQEAKKQAEQNPVFNLQTAAGPQSIDFGALRQAADTKNRAQQQATEQAYGPEYAKMTTLAQTMGVTDPKQLATMLNSAREADTKRAEAEKLRADANAEKEKLAQQYQMTAGQKFQVGMTAGSSRGQMAQHADDRQARTQFHADIAKDAGIVEKEYKTPHIEARKALNVIDTDPNNPETWIAARDFFVRAASGGKVTKAQYDQAASHSAPKFDQINQLIESYKTGMPSEAQRKNLRGAIETINKVTGQSLAEKQQEFKATYGDDPLVAAGDKTAAGTYERHAKRLFSETDEPAKKKANPLAAAAKMSTLKPQDKEAVQWAQANPNDPRSKAILDRNGL